ncbi:MAG: branched-chain alpha-keto acid dehydrogenase subunit E2 [Robiginitomaculum sp.]|nr:MAG: branched-chain alpha-keto acid dehydrogenase subunit E2 [Robiginitomaculum sp.]
MGQYAFKLPDVGEGVVEAEIIEWHVKVGQVIAEDDALVDVMTDKATVEIPAPTSGTISSITGEPGDVLAVGTVLLTIETEGEETAEPVAPVEAVAAPAPKAAPPASLASVITSAVSPAEEEIEIRAVKPSSSGRALASPALRKRALELQIDLGEITGSGPAGRISHQDLDDFIAAGRTQGAGGNQKQPRKTGTVTEKIIGLRRKIAQNLAASKRNIPHFSYVEEVEMDALETLRAHLNAGRKEGQAKLTLLPFLSLALIKTLPDFAAANAHFDGQSITKYAPVHLGIATATPNGLMVPVVKHAESLDIWALAAEIGRVSTAAREGNGKTSELSGSTITITSLGALGGIASTPVINAPETAIIGVNKLMEKLVFDRDVVVARKVMNLSSSFDHRVVDGFDAARMIQAVKGYLENPATLFM